MRFGLVGVRSREFLTYGAASWCTTTGRSWSSWSRTPQCERCLRRFRRISACRSALHPICGT
ncbi:hypothetical protein HBB16_04475 [Pseudonocardia sp. MCCB 268]|nr:hypothetical protein [Pseudonocardia cytotoxica]